MNELTNYGLIRNLLNARQMTPSDDAHPTNTSRTSVAAESDALRALIWIGAYIDRFHIDGGLDLETTERLSGLLLIVRDYVLPIPQQQDPFHPGEDLATPRLKDAIEALRQYPM